MALKLNPITGKLDLVGDGNSSQSPNFQATFNNSTDWGVASGGHYSISIGAATHGKGINPIVQVYELNGAAYEIVTVAVSVEVLTGNVVIGVVDTPDSRFEGKIIISENN